VTAAFQRMSDAFRAKLAGRDSKLCQLHPHGDAAAWSMQEVVEHLLLTYRGTVAQVEKYRKRGLSTQKKADWKQTAARIVVVGLGHFPRGTPSPEFVFPGRSNLAPMDGDTLAALFNEELVRLDSELLRCQEEFGDRPFAPHFRLGPLSPRQWRRFHLVHGGHHLKQLARIEKQLEGEVHH
jgi:hypothetical protein